LKSKNSYGYDEIPTKILKASTTYILFPLTYIFNTKSCYALRAIKPFMSTDVMKSIYYSYVHSILAYGIIFCGNSCFKDNIFKIQEGIIRVITNLRKCDSCRELLKKLQILTFQSQYIFSLLVFVVKNRSYFILNSDIHDNVIKIYQVF
jgi:hypothetical protein